MPVLLDDKPLATDQLATDATVAQLIALARSRLDGTGLAIVGLRHDDRDVPTEQVEQVLLEPISKFDDLELVSGRPRQIVLDALEQVHMVFADTFAMVKDAAALLAVGKLSEAMVKLAQCVRAWSQTHASIVQGGMLTGIDFEGLEIAGRPIVEWLNELATKLRELKDAIESRDNVLLGDILNYELDDTLQQWGQVLDGFIAHVEQLDDGVPAKRQQ
ncbi:MAG: hypothetical protein JXQ75_09975 [Phycisphaerae bacterium]|nr:hypothetical protein [Phycisphaerae bacterium]